MPLGDMKLAIDLGLNLSGFEQLANIAKSLEALHQMAGLTQTAFSQMGAGISHTLAGVSSQIAQVTNQLDHATQAAKNVQAATPGFLRPTGSFPQQAAGGTPGFIHPSVGFPAAERPAPSADAMRTAMIGEAQKKQAEAAAIQKRAATEQLREIEERRRTWSTIGSGIMTGVGFTAAFEVANLARTGMRAVGQLDARVAAMRMTGTPPQEINNAIEQATARPVHGVNLAERLFLQQEMSSLVGKPVSAESVRDVAIAARATSRITGQGDVQSNTRELLRAGDAFGNILNQRGELDERLLRQNVLVAEHMIAATQGFVNAETLMHNSRIAGPALQSLNIRGNERAQAQFAVLNEQLGERAGDTLNSMMAASQGMTKLMMSGGRMNGIKPVLEAMLTNVPNTDFLGRLAAAHKAISQMFANVPPQFRQERILGFEQQVFGTKAARGMEILNSPTGEEQVARTQRRLQLLAKDFDELDKEGRNFNDGLLAVKASFEDFATSLTRIGGLTKMLYGLSDALDQATRWMRDHPKDAGFVADIAKVVAGLIALRLAIAGLARVPGLLTVGAVPAVAGASAAMGGPAAAATSTAEAAVEGGIVGSLMTGMKSRLAGMATRGLQAYLIEGIAEATVDRFTQEGGTARELFHEALQGAGIGYAVGGIWGALVGAIADVVTTNAAQGISKAIKDHQDYAKEHPNETFVDPVSGTAVPGLKNNDVTIRQSAKDAQAEEDQREHDRFQGVSTGQSPQAQTLENIRRSRSWNHAVQMGHTNIPIPMAGAPHTQPGPHAEQPSMFTRAPVPSIGPMTPPNMTRPAPPTATPAPPTAPMAPPMSPAAMAAPTPPSVAGAAPTSALTPSTMSPNTITANTLVVQNVQGLSQGQQGNTLPHGQGQLPRGDVQPQAFTPPGSSFTWHGKGIQTMPGMRAEEAGFFPSAWTPPTQHGAAGTSQGWTGQPWSPAVAGAAPQAQPNVTGASQPAGSSQNFQQFMGGVPTMSGAAPSAAQQILEGVPSLSRDGTASQPGMFDSSPAQKITPSAGGGVGGKGASSGGGTASGLPQGRLPRPPGGGWEHTAPGQRSPMGAHGAAPMNMAGVKAAPFSGTHAQFFAGVQKDIYNAAIARGMPPEQAKTIAHVGASQASLETGYGQHMVGNNLFGIKAAGGVGAGSVQASTREVIGGKSVTQNASFAAFKSQQESAAGYVDFLTKNQRYKGLLAAASTGNEAAAIGALGASGYATDPKYAQGVASIAKTYPGQGSEVSPEQADVPTNNMKVTINSTHMLDGETIADTVAHHFIGGGPTASAQATAYDSKAMPLAPGVSIPRW